MIRTFAINKIAPAVLVLLAGLYLPGCNPARTDLALFDYRFEAADYNQAGLFAQTKIRKGNTPSGNDLLWTLQLATAERTQLNHVQAIASFDKAEEMLNYYAPQSELVDAVGSTIVNDNLVPYKGQEYDGIMVNTYKALDFLAEKNLDLARVELNRALDRQMRAREHFNEEIRKLEAKLEKQKQESSYDVKALANDPNTLAHVNAQYPNIDQFQPYPDFVNPFTTYLAAVYFALIGEYQRAGYLFKESAGMVPDNDYITRDLLLTDDIIAGKAKLENMVWVIFENGLGPVKEEVRIDIPLFLATSRVQYVGIALPRLRPRDVAYPCLILETDAGRCPTKQVADMDRVIQTEFQKDFRGILARAIASAVLKASAQYAVHNRKNNDLANDLAVALVGLYSYATTAADVRIWSALPKDFQVARCPIPQDRKLKIAPAGSAPFEVNIPTCNNAIVYVKIVRAGTSLVYEVLAF
jgi:hypothetical protein